ncbi:sacsin N-terminal ATP-binding-like domain-containing protein, partial [Vibrio genomosp. F10]|uniref:sacsin N-terminal ATP-binding-like domain-containing protein n=1 Tax=Vibrio genomosp. F10 TaxID=723171 RepID=UPI0018E9DC32
MNLKNIVNRLFDESKNDSARGLQASAESERIIQQAYEGRYLFELIQNVRDANKEIDADGCIKIELQNDVLSIANSGAEFSQAGIEGITTIGQSTKRSQDYIGYKGIGFKSVQEITDIPRIITKYGTVQFDRQKTINACIHRDDFTLDSVPLFFFPHFESSALSSDEIEHGFVTKVELPLKPELDETSIVDAFNKIGHRQLVLLGNINQLFFQSENKTTKLEISKHKDTVSVLSGDGENSKFRFYSPSQKITLPKELVNSLPKKEKEVFSSSTAIDVSVVIELNDKGHCNPVDDSKLYVFYPLKLSSGFRFIIHSYFVVNPERTALRDSIVNDYLLTAIGQFIANEVLTSLKKDKVNTTKMLCFTRNQDSQLDNLYDEVVKELSNKKFIYDKSNRNYYKPSEVILGYPESKSIFPSGDVAGKHLITCDEEISDWLQDEFDIQILEHRNLASQIEEECKAQAKNRNLKFFQGLYAYVTKHQDINLTEKKVLLTDKWKLVTSNEDVFYGGDEQTNEELPKSIRKHIHFIHKEIKIVDFRDGRSRTGIVEFNTFELTRRLLKLFNDDRTPNSDVLSAIYRLSPDDIRSVDEIKKKILLPISGTDKWLSPITNPIYVENENIRELYPDADFVDETAWEIEKSSETLVFWKKLGAWDIPAFYIVDEQVRVNGKEKRDRDLVRLLNLSSRPFIIKNDRVLDKPRSYNAWFKSSIIENWNQYEAFLGYTSLPRFRAASYTSNYRIFTTLPNKAIYGAVESLKTENWIIFSGEENAYSITNVVGIEPLELKQPHNKVISKYLNLLPVKYNFKGGFTSSTGLIHLDSDDISNYQRLLLLISDTYKEKIPDEQQFIDFYNRILGKLYSYAARHGAEKMKQLANSKFLAVNAITKTREWVNANEIYYIDDKLSYELLPEQIKEKVQPHFTNRDKNTFGLIAKEIGKQFSNQISKELIKTVEIKTTIISTYFQWLPQTIALLETHISRALSEEEFVRIKNTDITEVEQLLVGVTIGESGSINVHASNYVRDDQGNTAIYLLHSPAESKNKVFSSALNELFSKITKRNTHSFKPQLLSFLISTEKEQYLKDFDVEIHRVNEIKNELLSQEYSPEQLFWETILTIKQVSIRDDIYVDDYVVSQPLACLLDIPEVDINEFNDSFDFSHLNKSSHIERLKLLFDLLDISLNAFNGERHLKIDFREHYKQELFKLQNKFELMFTSLLHQELSNSRTNQQSTFQDQLDKYKNAEFCSSPENILHCDIDSYFIEQLSNSFPDLPISINNLIEEVNFDSIELYKKGLSEFEKAISTLPFNSEDQSIFLSKNSRRSLIYFNNITPLITQFKKYLSDKRTPGQSSQGSDGFSNLFDSVSDGATTDFEEVETAGVEQPTNP